MARLERPDNRLVIGKGGSGKSYLVRHQLAPHRRVLIHDTAEEPEVANLATDVIDTRTGLLGRLIEGGPFVIAWRGFARYGDDAFEIANRAAWAAEDCMVVWEEIDIFTDAGQLPPAAYKIIHLGRHRGLRTIATARAPALVARKHTRNVQRVIAFQTTEPRDIEYLAAVIGREAADQLPGLARREAMDWEDQGTAKLRQSPFL